VKREVLQEATRRGLAIADGIFPATFKAEAPHLLQVAVGMLARCVTTAESCLHLSELDRRTDLMVAVRTLYEHTLMLGWLTGSDEGEGRMMLLQRHNDEQALRIDTEMVAAGAKSSISGDTRKSMADLADALGSARLPSLADRAVKADSEWGQRLGHTTDDPVPWSFRSNYSSLYRPASAVAHPTWAGVRMVIERSQGSVVIDTEATGRGAEALQPVPALLGLALLISSHALGRPDPDEVLQFASWLADLSTRAD
jgi:hypothetical protein